MRKIIRSFDIFGKPISVSYQGSDSYRTVIGGIMSAFVFAIIIASAVMKAEILVSKKNPNISTTVEYDSKYESDE